jgi:two-component system, NtrC family, sensor kinase
MRTGPGLRLKTVVVTLVIFCGAGLVLTKAYVPSLEGRVHGQLLEVADDCLTDARELMQTRAAHLAERNRLQLLDLPFELTAGDPERTRALVERHALGLGRSYTRNVEFLTDEFRDRIGRKINERATELSGEFRRSALLLLGVLLLSVAVLHGAALARIVLLPVARLLKATERVAGGDLTERVGPTTGDEVGRLGRAFDQMTAALSASREEIEALNLSLADKVKEKTLTLEERNRELEETIEELKATRDALVHSMTMASIGTLAGGVAHEFNNLLGGIIGCASDASEAEPDEETADALKMILRTARRACNITENLLRFSRPSRRELKETDLSELVGEAVDLVRPEARKNNVTIAAELGDIEPVLVDPGQIHQVVLNLLTNAIHAMADGGNMTISVGGAEGFARIVVTDDGPGIDPEHRKRIFEPFFTTRTESGKEQGTGLGLSVSYSIVKEHGGLIDVESNPGEGARFTVRLPAGGEEE